MYVCVCVVCVCVCVVLACVYVCVCVYVCKSVRNAAHVRVLAVGFLNLKSRKFQLKIIAHHLGKFAPRENNPLYGTESANV